MLCLWDAILLWNIFVVLKFFHNKTDTDKKLDCQIECPAEIMNTEKPCKCFSRGVKLKVKTCQHSFKIKCSHFAHYQPHCSVTEQPNDTLQVNLHCLPWFSNIHLSETKQAWLTLLMLVKWDKLSSSSFQADIGLWQCCISCLMQDTGESGCIWYFFRFSCTSADCDQLELGR